jgi:hypothetical protein
VPMNAAKGLLHLNICAKLSEQSGIGMPKAVPADSLFDPQFLDGRMDLFSHDALSPNGMLPFGSVAGKHPIVGGTIRRHFSPRRQHLDQVRPHRDWLRRGLSLTPADNPVDDRTHEVDFQVVEVQVAPP